jgi:hypothetical protein
MTALRIVAWNCAMALQPKANALLALRPDVAVVPECGQAPELGDRSAEMAPLPAVPR